MKRIGLFVIVFFCISLLLHASGPRVLFIGDSITDGNWGKCLRDAQTDCGTKPLGYEPYLR